jgi:hypothetical protein
MTSRLRKGLGLAGNIAKSMIKTSLKIDIDDIFKSDNAEAAGKSKAHSILDAFEKMELSLDVDPSKVQLSGSKSKNKPLFIVFDDLERVDMDVTVILGYINNLTEHSNVHVVILADEEKLLNLQTINEFQHSYADVKEKLIGITFEVQHNLKGMFDDFVTPVHDVDVQLLLQKHRDRLISIHETSGYGNLRILKRVMQDFAHVYQSLPSFSKGNTKFLEVILAQYAVLSIEYRKNPSDIEKLLNSIGSVNWDTHFEEIQNEAIGTVRVPKISSIEHYKHIVDVKDLHMSANLWRQLIVATTCDTGELSQSLTQNSRFFQQNPEPWQQLRNYRYLTRTEFYQALKDTETMFFSDESEFPLVEDLLQTCDLLLYLLGKGNDEQINKLIEQTKTRIDRIAPEKLLQFAQDGFDLDFHYSNSQKPFKDSVLPYVKSKKSNTQTDLSNAFSTVFLKNVRENSLDELHKMIVNNEILQDTAWLSLDKSPVLANVCINDFLDAFIDSDAAVYDKLKVFLFLGQRQRLKNLNEEKDWFSELAQEYQHRLNHNKLPLLERLFFDTFLQKLKGGSD